MNVSPEFSFFEGLLLLFQFLMMIVLMSLAAAVALLPVFYAVILLISKWLGAADGLDFAERPVKAAVNAAVWIVLPVAAVGCTFFLFGQSGLIDYMSGRKPGVTAAETNPVKRQVQNRFEDLTRNLTGKADLIAEPESDPIDQDRELEKLTAKKQLRLVRSFIVFAIYQLGPIPLLVILASVVVGRRKMQMIVRSLTRNPLRTSLMYIAIFVLSSVLVCVWSVLAFIDAQTVEKEGNLKAIISEKQQIPSQMKPTHVNELMKIVEELPEENKPKGGDGDLMTWAFVGGTLDIKNRTPKNSLFFFAMEPRKVLTMLDGLEDLTEEQRKLLTKAAMAVEEKKTGVVIGFDKLNDLGKRVGDRIQFTSTNYKDLVFDMEIIGTFPVGTRYDQSAVMHRDYLYQMLQSYEGINAKAHPLADKCLNLIWLRLPDKKSFDVLAERVAASGRFNPAIKMETSSAGISTFLDAYKEVLWGLRWILAPVLMGTMTLIIANAISISVRERRTEMAVLKVLGYQPRTIMFFVLGEAIFIGALSGFLAMCLISVLVNVGMGGLNLQIAFFGRFFIPDAALWWGPAVGTFASLIGSIIPAWSARSVKVTDVFSRVA